MLMTDMTPAAAMPAAKINTPIPARMPEFLKLYIEKTILLIKIQSSAKK